MRPRTNDPEIPVSFFFLALKVSAVDAGYPGGWPHWLEIHGEHEQAGDIAVRCAMGAHDLASPIHDLEDHGLEEAFYTDVWDGMYIGTPPPQETFELTPWLHARTRAGRMWVSSRAIR
ncbi:MAG: hypothetical protein QGG40_07420 [Myxococcota bacterium]|jgi:hypothetical protein|nr:hypothetical protein [Myxococcota bacterium]